ncbi:unnamed protein product [Orchesella dallaii]|uniref:Odorant receptor n=1 Tax=Orchesella dallaii TaxID=48710 RepID=A0ABP1RH76_9HEXA
MCAVATVMYKTQNIHQTLIRNQLQVRLQIGNILDEINRTSSDRINKLLVPTIAILFLSFPSFMCLLPLQINYDPPQLILSAVESYLTTYYLPQFIVKSIACFICGSTTFYGAGIVLSVALFAIMDMEAIQQESHKLYLTSPQQIRQNAKYIAWARVFTQFNRARPNVDNSAFSQLKFQTSLRLFRMIRIRIQKANEIMQTNLFVWIGMGMCLCVCCLYTTIRLRGVLQLATYLSCPLIYSVFHLCVWLYFTLAAISRRTGEKFNKFWRCFVFGKRERLELRACPPFGYSVGPLRRVNESTAFSVAFSVVDWTASLVVM